MIITFSSRFYNLLVFYIHIWSYIALLLNDWSTTMITLCCFSSSGCNSPLIMTHFLSNDSISIIESISLVNTRDFAHCSEWALLSSIWKLRYYFTDGVIFWLSLWVVLLSWYFSDSGPNKTWALGSVKLLLFCRGVSNDWGYSLTNIFVIVMFFVYDRYRCSLNNIIGFIVYKRGCTIMCLCSKWLFTCDMIFLFVV